MAYMPIYIAAWLERYGTLLGELYALREGFTKKNSCSFGFFQMRGEGEGPAQIFRPLFIKCIFGQ